MNKKAALKVLLRAAVAIVFWLAVWMLISWRAGSELLFPDPIAVLKALFELSLEADFWLTTLFSLLRVIIAILISLILGTLLAVATEKFRVLNYILSPMIGVIKSTPVASFIILALLWISRDTLPVFITALIVVPIVWSNVSEGIRSVDKDLVQVTQVYNFTAKQKILRLYVPSIAPFFMAACKSSLGMAWKAGISAEVLSTPERAIGTELYFSKTYLETPSLFAWTAVIIILSILIEKLFVLGLEKLGMRMRFFVKGDGNDKA